MIKKGMILLILVLFFYTSHPICRAENDKTELRGMWVSNLTDDKLDYQSEERFRSSVEKLIATSQKFHFNTLYYQVRTTNDAFYCSKINPWSKYLYYVDYEKDVVAPSFDPLQLLIEACHKSNIQLHAWFNPYRITTSAPGVEQNVYLNTLHPLNFAKQHPEYILVDCNGAWMLNPGEPEVNQFVVQTIMEVVENYDIDGVHLDDNFYSYAGYDSNADLSQYNKYATANQTLASFRRNNIDQLVEGIYKQIKFYNSREGKQIQYGISPFGIWRNQKQDENGSATNGVSSYDDLYADTKKWVEKQWIDYIAPQIYWNLDFEIAAYPVLVDWWSEVVATTKVNLYIGHAVYKYVTPPKEWKDHPDELYNQLEYNQTVSNVKGSIFFSYRFFRDIDVINDYEIIQTVMQKISTNMWKEDIAAPIPELTTTCPLDSVQQIEILQPVIANQFVDIVWTPAIHQLNQKIDYQIEISTNQLNWETLILEGEYPLFENGWYRWTFRVPEGLELFVRILTTDTIYQVVSPIKKYYIRPAKMPPLEQMSALKQPLIRLHNGNYQLIWEIPKYDGYHEIEYEIYWINENGNWEQFNQYDAISKFSSNQYYIEIEPLDSFAVQMKVVAKAGDLYNESPSVWLIHEEVNTMQKLDSFSLQWYSILIIICCFLITIIGITILFYRYYKFNHKNK